MAHCYTYIESPVGRLFVQGDGHFVTGLFFPGHKHWKGPDHSWRQSDESFAIVRQQLAEYFDGGRQEFDFPFRFTGTTFQQRVWKELMNIPFGTTITYAQLAERINKPAATRAVGNANGRNPISIIVPCHRVIGANGKLTGYGGGLHNKEWLLAFERASSKSHSGQLFDIAANARGTSFTVV